MNLFMCKISVPWRVVRHPEVCYVEFMHEVQFHARNGWETEIGSDSSTFSVGHDWS